VANILAKSNEQDAAPPDSSLFQEPAEHALHNAITQAGQALTPLIAERDYHAALEQLATLRAPVDDFFESVMVNAENPAGASQPVTAAGHPTITIHTVG
jgi:glycyl-tRNA synthetase beta chain